MAPAPLFSLSQLAFLHTSLSLHPPIRPDARHPTTFRPLRAEIDFLPAANGSARVCFAEGGEAVVGVRAEVEESASSRRQLGGEVGEGDNEEVEKGSDSWVEVAIELREDEAEGGGRGIFLAEMLREGLLADGELSARLVIGRRWHWRLFVDIVLLSPPSTYPLPLLSLTTHLALLSCRLPALTSSFSPDDDPLFNDDWDAAVPLYPFTSSSSTTNLSSQTQTQKRNKKRRFTPPITLLVISVGENIFIDPSSEELAVADAVVGISVGKVSSNNSDSENDDDLKGGGRLKLLAIRTIDPPSRLLGAAGGMDGRGGEGEGGGGGGGQGEEGVWKKRMGGMKRGLVGKMIKMVLEEGVGGEVFKGLETWS